MFKIELTDDGHKRVFEAETGTSLVLTGTSGRFTRKNSAQQANAEKEAENGRLREQLAAAQATATSVQAAMDAVLARIGTPETGEDT